MHKSFPSLTVRKQNLQTKTKEKQNKTKPKNLYLGNIDTSVKCVCLMKHEFFSVIDLFLFVQTIKMLLFPRKHYENTC